MKKIQKTVAFQTPDGALFATEAEAYEHLAGCGDRLAVINANITEMSQKQRELRTKLKYLIHQHCIFDFSKNKFIPCDGNMRKSLISSWQSTIDLRSADIRKLFKIREQIMSSKRSIGTAYAARPTWK